jgi:putative ABC transport system ATP-binding protein
LNTKPSPLPVIHAINLSKVYRMGEIDVHALRGVSLDVTQGESLAIMGPSGSGKSTLMNMIGCLDSPSGGQYFLDGQLVSNLRDDELAVVRNKKIGFVFQKYNLLPRATALDNVALPLRYSSNRTDIKARSIRALEAVGLADRMAHRPNELSGGQQQRVAIARALVNEPAIILADEPTGNLDTQSGAEIMQLLLSLNREQGTTLVIVTHDPDIAMQTGRIVRLLDGQVLQEAIAE